jgi:hypothetical protein
MRLARLPFPARYSGGQPEDGTPQAGHSQAPEYQVDSGRLKILASGTILFYG